MQTHFPSGDGSDLGTGLVLVPFRGVRYDVSRVGGLANVTSPPYDVIGPGSLDGLRAASPFNVVRLILPASVPGETAGVAAAALLRDWLANGALMVDEVPALYVYEQHGPGWVQRGLIGLVAVGTDAVHPHEGVMPGPVAGRLELMKATRSNLEPILLVYRGGPDADSRESSADWAGPSQRNSAAPCAPGLSASGLSTSGLSASGLSTSGLSASRLTDLTAESSEPLASAVTGDGVSHRLWAVTDPAALAAIADDLAARTALIADGHHRYAAYRELQTEMHEAGAGDGPWDYGLAFLVDADAYPLRLGPIHRVLPHLPLDEAARLAGGAFTVTDLGAVTGPGTAADSGILVDPGGAGAFATALESALGSLGRAAESGPAFLLAGREGFRLLTQPDQRQLAAAMPSDASSRWRALDAAVMRQLLLAHLWSIKDNERDVLIAHDAAEAVRMAIDSGGTAVLCNPMPIDAVMDLAAHGEKVPRKSTSFGPKPRTGLVLRAFDS